ncbi:MAG: hypothetical protein WC654_06125, partial [Patescibacteria group bacterium]
EKDEEGEEDEDEVEEEEGDDKKDKKDEEEEDDEEEDKPKIKNPERWHGKSREDVIREIESMEGKKGKGEGDDKKKETDKKKTEVGKIEIPSNEELSKMSPAQFAEWVLKHIQSQVDSTVQERSAVQQSVAQEIREAKKDHPLLKTNAEYRELVLALIDNAAQKGVHMPLKEACAKVDAFSGTAKGETTTTDKERTRLKKAKAVVERGGGSSASPDDGKGAETKRLENVFGTGGSKSPLGGLGV